MDDYIPVREVRWGENNKRVRYVPAFLSVQPLDAKDKKLQIWPFLLEKAYANYYSSYEVLRYGNALDFTA